MAIFPSICGQRRTMFGVIVRCLVFINVILLIYVIHKKSLREGLLSSMPDFFARLRTVTTQPVPTTKPTTEARIINPPATITTSIRNSVEGHEIDKSYIDGEYFWGRSVNEGDNIDIMLNKPIRLYKIVIVSGDPDHDQDKLLDSALQISTNSEGKCTDYHQVKEFHDVPVIDYTFIEKPKARCIRLTIKKVRVDSANNPFWLIIKDIRIN